MPAIDRRELILVRLFEICQSFEAADLPLRRIRRNATNISGNSGKAIVLMDGTEEPITEIKATRQGMAVKLIGMMMLPKIQLFNNGSSDTIGTSLNALRLEMIVAVQDDAELAEIGGNSYGAVNYIGCEPEIETGEKAEGRIDVKFAISYPLIGSEIRTPPLPPP
jgi:hypothetical protein